MLATIEQILDYLPPGHPVTAGSKYWQNLLIAADSKVKEICGRRLERATYTDRGLTVEIADNRFAFYFREPANGVLSRDDIDTLTLNGVDVNDDSSSRLEEQRVILPDAGEVLMVYTGGYQEGDWQLGVIRSAVADVLLILHRLGQMSGMSSYTGAGENFSVGQDPFAAVKEKLKPFTIPKFGIPYAGTATG